METARGGVQREWQASMQFVLGFPATRFLRPVLVLSRTSTSNTSIECQHSPSNLFPGARSARKAPACPRVEDAISFSDIFFTAGESSPHSPGSSPGKTPCNLEDLLTHVITVASAMSLVWHEFVQIVSELVLLRLQVGGFEVKAPVPSQVLYQHSPP